MSGPTGSEDPRLGTVLQDRYKVVARVAGGAMGSVYRGERTGLGRAVAIKFLHAAFMREPEFKRRFETEARVMSRLSHPHCVSVIDFGVADVPFLVMDFVNGRTLRDLIDLGPLPAPRALLIIKQILGGLAHAHGKDVVHRDIKPANVMLTEATGTGDHVRLLDFGLAKLLSAADAAATAPMAIGTPSYMSPEQARGENVDARADVYGVGILLYELLTGEKPFVSDEAMAILRMHLEDPPPPLAAKAPPGVRFSSELERVVQRALAKKPADRFPGAAEFAEALSDTPEGQVRWPPVPAALRDEPSRAPVRRAAPKSRSKQALVVGVSLLAMSSAAALALRDRGQDPPSASELTDEEGVVLAAAVARPEPDASPAPAPGAPPDAPGAPVAAPTGADVEPPPAAAAAPTPPRPQTIAEARRLMKAGDNDAAFRVLTAIRRENPKNALAHLYIGHLQFERSYYTDGLDSYDNAVALQSGLRTNTTLLGNVMRAFAFDKTRPGAEALITRRLGRAALPFLDRAAKNDKSKVVRARAAALAKKLRRPR